MANRPVLIYKRDLDKIAKKLQKCIKKTIVKMGHVRTGAMRDSVDVKTSISADGFAMEVDTIFYFEFVEKRFKIMKEVYKTTEFKQIKKDINKLISDGIKRNLKRIKDKNKRK